MSKTLNEYSGMWVHVHVYMHARSYIQKHYKPSTFI